MSGFKNFKPLLRAAVVLGAVGTITTAGTFAALQSQQSVLAGNTINSATAALSVSTDNITFGNSKTGFSFNGIIPGGAAVPVSGDAIWLQNGGSTNLAIKAAISSTPANASNVDLSKVFLHITRPNNSFDQSFSLKSLIDGYATGGVAIGDTINISAAAQYFLRVSMSSDAFSGSNSVTISGVDLVFTGTAQ